MAKTGASLIDGGRPLKIAIVGGSCAGLFTGILLKRMGHNVRVLESTPSSIREGMAAGIGLASHVQRFFDEQDRLRHVPFTTPSETQDILGAELHVLQKYDMHLDLTTWDAVYYRLRANFDALQSPYCPNPPGGDADDGEASFTTGVRAIRVRHDTDTDALVVEATEVNTGEPLHYEADFVIAADGANSTIRQQLQPNLQRKEPGYMIWRGVVPADKLPKEGMESIMDARIIHPVPGDRSYMVIYSIPGENGALGDDERALNLAWYAWPSHSSVAEVLTDTSGHTHRTTLPKGKMRPEVWEAEVAKMTKLVSPILGELIAKIDKPFASVVSSIISTHVAFFNNRLFLVGDALAQVQPNTAQGTNMAALAALLIRDVFAKTKTVAEFEKEILKTVTDENANAIAVASRFLC